MNLLLIYIIPGHPLRVLSCIMSTLLRRLRSSLKQILRDFDALHWVSNCDLYRTARLRAPGVVCREPATDPPFVVVSE